jgi:hypothetical protein
LTTSHPRRFFVVTAATGLVAAIACGSDRHVECNTGRDCPTFYTCGPEHTCLKAGGCLTTADCIASNAGKPFLCRLDSHACIEGCEDSSDGGRTGNQECADAFGPKFICRDSKCVEGCNTATEECPRDGGTD